MHHFEAMKSSNVHFTFFRMGKILEGLLAGAVEAEVPHGVECLRDAKHIWERFGGVIDQLKHATFNSVLHALEDLGHVIHDIANELEECKATVGTDLDKLREMSKSFTDPWYFIFHIEHDLIVNGQDIHHEIMDAEAQWDNQHFYEFGHSVGLSLSKIFLGGQMANQIPLAHVPISTHVIPTHHAPVIHQTAPFSHVAVPVVSYAPVTYHHGTPAVARVYPEYHRRTVHHAVPVHAVTYDVHRTHHLAPHYSVPAYSTATHSLVHLTPYHGTGHVATHYSTAHHGVPHVTDGHHKAVIYGAGYHGVSNDFYPGDLCCTVYADPYYAGDYRTFCLDDYGAQEQWWYMGDYDFNDHMNSWICGNSIAYDMCDNPED